MLHWLWLRKIGQVHIWDFTSATELIHPSMNAFCIALPHPCCCDWIWPIFCASVTYIKKNRSGLRKIGQVNMWVTTSAIELILPSMNALALLYHMHVAVTEFDLYFMFHWVG